MVVCFSLASISIGLLCAHYDVFLWFCEVFCAVGNNPNVVLPAYQLQLKAAQGVINKVCNIFNANDAIGTISDTYGPPTFGAGIVHSTLSTPYSDSGRDFVLTYQIKPVQEQPLQSKVPATT